jgi:murein L,D-transpeptidase YcbB/YkuD
VAEQPPAPPPVDPLLAEVRRQLAEPARGNVDRAALAAFYAVRNDPLLWVAAGGLTAKARHAMAEIAKADDWGLVAGAFELPQLAQGEASPAALAGAEIKLGLAALKYARHARGGRLDPAQISKHIDQKPPLLEPKTVLDAVAATDTPGDYLRGLHPKHPQFQLLRQALLKARGGQSKPEASAEEKVKLPSDGPLLRSGMEHADVALLRRRLKVAAEAGRESVLDPALEQALVAFQRESRITADGVVGRGTRAALNGEARPALAGTEAQRLIVNMERWRWMPERLGELYVQDNLPEFMTRVVKKGEVIHSARIVIGKVDTPTAVFSANMRMIVFHPEWGVPDSIKVKELAPYLSGGGGGGFFFFGGGDTSILDRQRLRVVYNGRPVSPSSVDWGQVDIRRFTFIQSAGPHNVLGVVKFMFPNRHDIYMHDTPQRELLERPVRMFSHGCMRVQNPGRLAEILLAEDKGWPAERVRGLLAEGYNNEVQLAKEIPVHVTYFTAVVDEGGRVSHFGDNYGYDSRMAAALGGKPLPPEVVAGEEQPAREVRQAPRPKKQSDFLSGLFGN